MNKNYVSCIIFCYILIYDNHAWNSEIKKKKHWVNCDPVFGKHEKYKFLVGRG
jgi:hypothetical protein